MRTGPNGRRYENYDLADTRNLSRSRGWAALGLLKFELSPGDRAARVEAYARQVEQAGHITAWLPPAAGARARRQLRSLRNGRQHRWFTSGTLAGSTWSPAFVPGG